MAVNAKTSACLRFGPRYKNTCASVMVCGCPVNWVTSGRGVYPDSSFTFKCSFAVNKSEFYKAFNCISLSGKIGRIASPEVIFALIKGKCLPILLYGTKARPENSAIMHFLQFALHRALLKIFGALSKDT